MKQLDFRSTPLLLVGRDPDMLTLLREVLIEAGFFVVARLLDGFLLNLETSEDRPSLILYDETTPEIDAERIYYLLQDSERWSETPFLILSDHFDGARVARCLDRGVDEFITKPFDVDELGARVRKLLRNALEHDDHLSSLEGASQAYTELEGFAGDLSYMNLSDLLINLHQNLRAGELMVTMDSGDFTFYLQRGQLVAMEGPHGMRGKKALYRAIREFYGKFVFSPYDESDQIPVETADYGPLPNLILSAVQEADEYPLTRKELPADPDTVKIASEEASQILFAGDFRILRPLLKSPDRTCTINQLIDSYPKTDLETARELLEMFERDLLVAT